MSLGVSLSAEEISVRKLIARTREISHATISGILRPVPICIETGDGTRSLEKWQAALNGDQLVSQGPQASIALVFYCNAQCVQHNERPLLRHRMRSTES